ncbi:MAG: response regulator [Nitrospira sp.]|nr:response regulator [Nitrospira sp.]
MKSAAGTKDRDWLIGGGEMGARTRAFDWSTTPLGPMDRWPQSLKTAVSIMLGCQYPLLIWWGDELIHFYNDAYLPVLGKRHPGALGQPAPVVWSEAWPLVGPQADAVMREGRSHWNEELLIVMTRNGYQEEVYMTFSYGPILDDRGQVGGVFCACTEETSRVLGRRRLATLRALADRSYQAKSADEACAIAAGELIRNPHDVPCALWYLLEPDGTSARLAGQVGLPAGHAAAPQVIELGSSDSPWPLHQVMNSKQPLLVDRLPPRVGLLPGGPWPEPAQRALVLPMIKAGQQQLAGWFIAGLSPRLELDDSYRGFLDLLARQAGTAVANASAYAEERQRAEALEELDRAKTVFFSNVSHEFRTPLTLMLGPLEEALSSESRVPANVREELTVAHRNGLRLLKLVNTLLDFSRIESGRIDASYEPVDFAGFTAELASNFRSAVERAGMTLSIECPRLAEPVWLDREMWEKVVLNLLSNALKFTFDGDIAVRTSLGESHAELVVNDSGTGISESNLPRIFERFHRIRGARSRTHEGSGIGLALVQELVKLHGGTIGVASRVGVGTIFTVRIPRGKAHLPPDRIAAPRLLASTGLGAGPFVEEALRWLPAEASPGSSSEPDSKPTDSAHPRPAIYGGSILLADDNADMRDYVTRLLSGQYSIQAVVDGTSALRAALAHPPDLVLADIMMPGMDGLELLRALRAEPSTRHIPIILLSARAGEESKVQGLDAGADDYLVKPFAARELFARVKAHLELAGARRAELDRANTVIRDGRQAALNILEDAVQARDRIEELHRDLQHAVIARRQAESALQARDAQCAPDQRGLRRLHDVQTKIATERDLHTAFDEILSAACDLTGTPRGCLQVVSDDGVRLDLVAWRGYAEDNPYLEYLRYQGAKLACDRLPEQRVRIMVDDIDELASPADRKGCDIALAEQIRAMQSTPLINHKGDPVGLLSTQFDRPHQPTDDELKLLDLLAWMAATIIERDRDVCDLTRPQSTGV